MCTVIKQSLKALAKHISPHLSRSVQSAVSVVGPAVQTGRRQCLKRTQRSRFMPEGFPTNPTFFLKALNFFFFWVTNFFFCFF